MSSLHHSLSGMGECKHELLLLTLSGEQLHDTCCRRTHNHSLPVLPALLVSCPLTPSHCCASFSPLVSCSCAFHSFCCAHPSCSGCARDACIFLLTVVCIPHVSSHCVSNLACLGFYQTPFSSYHWISLHILPSCVPAIHTHSSTYPYRYLHACSESLH